MGAGNSSLKRKEKNISKSLEPDYNEPVSLAPSHDNFLVNGDLKELVRDPA